MTLAFVVPGLDEAASEKAIAILQNRLSQEQEAALVLKPARPQRTASFPEARTLERDRPELHRRSRDA